MPELNFDNEPVRQAVLDVAAYWLESAWTVSALMPPNILTTVSMTENAEFWTWYIGAEEDQSGHLYRRGGLGRGRDHRPVPGRVQLFPVFHIPGRGLIAETATGGDVNKLTKGNPENYLDSIHGKESGSHEHPLYRKP